MNHWVDFSTMRMISVHDESDQKEIKRGDKPGERRQRPTPERFLDSSTFLVGKFKAITNHDDDKERPCGLFLG